MLFILSLWLHFIADFLLQSREMGQKKSYELKWLNKHLSIQFFVMFLGLLPFTGYHIAILFAFYNSCIHGVIDWYIWRGYKASVWLRNRKYGHNKEQLASTWKYWEDHLFYTTIGFDQALHITTLALLWKYLA